MLSLLRKLGGSLFGRQETVPVPPRPDSALCNEIRSLGSSPERWCLSRRDAQRLYGPAQPFDSERLKARFPDQLAATLDGAETVLRHEFDMLGSGPFTPADEGRKPYANGYRPIDWSLDPVSGLRFPMTVPHKEWDLYAMRPGLADIKLPWELARCQHWPTLAQAFRLTGDERYAVEIGDQLQDFMTANPVGIGINWTCTMDVALRVLNWAVALEWIAAGRYGDSRFWMNANDALFEHGRFIFDNLENNYEVTSNHFLSNVVGLYYLAEWFAGLPSADAWRAFCREALETEITVQVLEDGADFESAIPYHRLVTELFLGAARLADFAGAPLSGDYKAVLSKMVGYLHGVLRPDGLMPQCGDADDGRLHIFSRYKGWQPQDPRHLFALAAHLLDRPDWRDLWGEDGAWEAYWWGFEPTGEAVDPVPPSAAHCHHPDAGHAVYRDDDAYLLISNGIVGTEGFGNHKHNDQLSFEYHAGGIPLIVDPGSFVYTSDPDARNLFRSTGYHNTLEVDGAEQNETNPEWLFRLMESGTPETMLFERSGDRVDYRGRHIGYRRLDSPVTHERAIRLYPKDHVLLIADTIYAEGRHALRWHFHAAPQVKAVENPAAGPAVAVLEAGGKTFGLASLDERPVLRSEGHYSPSYGKKVPCPIFDFRWDADVNGKQTWMFAIAPLEWLTDDRSKEVIRAFAETVTQAAAQ